jgi:hypothetical protein
MKKVKSIETKDFKLSVVETEYHMFAVEVERKGSPKQVSNYFSFNHASRAFDETYKFLQAKNEVH